jgi:tetratricopeptide (TPR) repeat protein
MSLIFQQNQALGSIVPSDREAAEKQLQQIHELLGPTDQKQPNPKKILRGLKSMISKDPLFLRGYALAGQILHDLEDEAEAAEMFNKGCRAGLRLIPEGFEGPLDTEAPDVQFFLRCHTGYIESLMGKHEYPAALAACRRQLVFDPEDMFGRGLELGELCIMAGEPDEAESILLDRVEEQGTAWYSLAYLSFSRGSLVEAVTRLRRAFLKAPYTVDFLTGRMTSPNPFWEQGPQAPSFSECLFYLDALGGEMWSENQEAHDFMEWLSQTSTALGERAEMVELSESCFGQASPGPGEEEAYENLWRGIDDESSSTLIRLVQDPETCEEIHPWRLLALHHERLSQDEEGCGCGCGHDHGDDECEDDR